MNLHFLLHPQKIHIFHHLPINIKMLLMHCLKSLGEDIIILLDIKLYKLLKIYVCNLYLIIEDLRFQITFQGILYNFCKFSILHQNLNHTFNFHHLLKSYLHS
jgi:hypothetical protein